MVNNIVHYMSILMHLSEPFEAAKILDVQDFTLDSD